MKTNKRILAALTASALALTPCFAVGVTAYASNLTINNAADDATTHVYYAYPIITGTKSDDTLTNMSWGAGVNSSALITALSSFDSATFGSLTGSSTAKEVADKLSGYSNKEGLAKVFNGSGILNSSSRTQLTKDGSGNYTATGLTDGWYLVNDEISTTGVNVRSANLLQIVGDTTAQPKYSLPTLNKYIVEDSTDKVANEASMGELVNYKLTTKVPDMTGYNKYFFVINDTLSDGLTFNASSVNVTLNGSDLTKDTDYEVQTDADASGNTFQIVFKNFIEKKANAGEDIVVTYNATLDEDAVITDAGNPNTANLTYSNDPNHTYNGGTDGQPDGPDEPGSGEPKGVTPNQVVKTYTTAVKIKKVDENNNALSGAEFTLTSTTGSVKTVVVIKDTFIESDGTEPAGTTLYYKLKTGLFTETAPDSSNGDLYESTSQTYVKTQTITTKDTTSSGVTASCEVGTDGIAVFKGLGAGSYTLTESNTPNGYNTISPITFTVGNSSAPDGSSAHWSVTSSDATFTSEDNMYAVTIQNVKGAQLPTTGGIGTKLFYLFGGMLVVGSSVVLITKKRMSAEEK